MECYSAIKGKDNWTHATIWMNLEDTVWSETSSSQKDKDCDRIVRFIETESRMMTARVWEGRGNGELLLNGYQF